MASKDKRENGSAMGDAEFEKLLDEMDELGRQADVLREKGNHLIDEMRENDVVADEEAENESDGNAAGGEGNEESETGEQAVDEDAGGYGNPEGGSGVGGEQEAVDDTKNRHPEGPPAAGTAH